MKGQRMRNKKPVQGTILAMSFVWMSLALVSFILDPEKNIVITSLVMAGLFSLIFFLALKLKKSY
jgi:hypothetical protein